MLRATQLNALPVKPRFDPDIAKLNCLPAVANSTKASAAAGVRVVW